MGEVLPLVGRIKLRAVLPPPISEAALVRAMRLQRRMDDVLDLAREMAELGDADYVADFFAKLSVDLRRPPQPPRSAA